MQKTIQKEFKIEKVIKKKGDRLYVKWKGYDNSFNSAENMKVALDLFNYAMKVDLKEQQALIHLRFHQKQFWLQSFS